MANGTPPLPCTQGTGDQSRGSRECPHDRGPPRPLGGTAIAIYILVRHSCRSPAHPHLTFECHGRPNSPDRPPSDRPDARTRAGRTTGSRSRGRARDGPNRHNSRTPTAKPPAKRRRRCWPFIVGGVLLLLVLLVVLLPTIASTGVVRSIVVGQINKAMNGRVQIDSWSLGWTSGQRISGVRVFDAAGSQIAELQSLTTQLSLLDAIQGKYDFGETVIRGLDFNIKQYADGTNSVTRLVNTTSPKQETSSPIPSINILLKLVDCRGTIDKEPVPGPAGSPAAAGHHIQLTSLEGQAKVTDINQPVENNFKAVAAVDNHAARDARPERHDRRHPRQQGFPRLRPRRRDGQAREPGLGHGRGVPPRRRLGERIAGRDGWHAPRPVPRGGQGGDLGRRADAEHGRRRPGLRGGGELPGRHVPPRRPADDDRHVRRQRPLGILAARGRRRLRQPADRATATRGNDKVLDLSLAARTTLQAVMNASKNLKPGADGFVRVGLRTDVGKLGIPRTLAMQNSVQLRSGVVDFGVDAGFAADRADLKSLKLDVTDVAGRNTAENRDFTLQPIRVAAKATSFGGGMAVPDLPHLARADRPRHAGDLHRADPLGTERHAQVQAGRTSGRPRPGDRPRRQELQGGRDGRRQRQGNFLPAATQPAATQPVGGAVAEGAHGAGVRIGRPHAGRDGHRHRPGDRSAE